MGDRLKPQTHFEGCAVADIRLKNSGKRSEGNLCLILVH
jgi:hypothetical protein